MNLIQVEKTLPKKSQEKEEKPIRLIISNELVQVEKSLPKKSQEKEESENY